MGDPDLPVENVSWDDAQVEQISLFPIAMKKINAVAYVWTYPITVRFTRLVG